MTDSIEEAIRQATLALEEATSRILTMAHEIARLRDDRAELRRALYECSYCLNSLDIAPSAMTKVGSMSSGTCTCEARTECVRSQDAWPRGVHGTSEGGFLVE